MMRRVLVALMVMTALSARAAGGLPRYDRVVVLDKKPVTSAHMDGNGALDVVLSNDTPDAKLIYLNDGKGHFRAGPHYGKPEWPTRNITLADLDGDRLPGVVVANRSAGQLLELQARGIRMARVVTTRPCGSATAKSWRSAS
jgi:hypothetical protein